MNKVQSYLNKKGFIVADGATGTELINMGLLKKGLTPEHILLQNPEAFVKLHRSYYDAGSDYVIANNFGATRTKLEEWGLASEFEKINRSAVRCVKKALKESGKKALIGSGLGPTGRLLPPMGSSTMEELINIYKEQVKIILDEGVDFFVLETFSDIREAKAAYIAIRDLCEVPVGVCMTFDENERTLFNNSPESFAVTFDSTDVIFIGVNCSVGPKEISSVISRIGEYTSKPIIVKPNAGVSGVHYTADDFVSQLDTWIASGARIFGGCCGTNAEHIRALSKALKKKKMVKKIKVKEGTHIASLSKVVSAGMSLPPVMIGERINPTNKKEMIDELKAGKLDLVKEAARVQITDGAGLLDVNLGAAGVDQKEMMKKAFHLLSSIFETPLVVDSSNIDAIEAALRSYGGKALINSTTADKEKADAIFTLARKYGAAVIGLTMSEKGIPMTATERLELAEWLLKKAKTYGIKPSDLIIDTLTLSLSSNQNEALESIKAVEMVGKKLKLSTLLGVSNVSYGLPERANLNQAFLTIAINAGVNFVIMNPSSEKMRAAVDSMNVIKAYDAFSVEYVKRYSNVPKGTIEKRETPKDALTALNHAIIDGDEVKAKEAAKLAMDKGLSLADIAARSMIPAIEIVGKYFKDGKYFLPQVVLSAQAMKKAFELLRSGTKDSSINYRGRVIMATVKGDIHDIGKNIVITLLETNGFEVVDLGKSVPSYEIVAKAKEFTPDVIGLSALMTTTMEEMGVIVKDLKKEGISIPVMVGGAVVTDEFARSIGAKFYAKDAMQAVDILKQLKDKN